MKGSSHDGNFTLMILHLDNIFIAGFNNLSYNLLFNNNINRTGILRIASDEEVDDHS